MGYEFTGASGAREVLERMKNPAPKGLLGMMKPETGDWLIVFEFTDVGYVKGVEKEPLDAEAILKKFTAQVERQNLDRKKQDLPLIGEVVWELKPQCDASDNTLEWAVQTQTGSQGIVNHTVRLLGRHGMLDAICVRPYRGFTDLAPLKQLVKGVSFKQGERYADYQPGDKLSTLAMADLIVNDDSSDSQTASAGATTIRSGPALWAGLGLGACLGIATLALLAGKFRRRRSSRRSTRSSAPPAQTLPVAMAPPPAFTPAVAAPAEQPPAPALSPVIAQTKAAPAHRPVNHRRHGSRRKRVFDYNRYFADLMSSVSSHGTPVEAPPVNGSTVSLDHPAASPAPVNGKAVQPMLFDANSELISHQTTFIEEQRRLMQEQSKLIEEKSKLIAEKNHLLKLQSELFENKLL